MNHLIVAHFQSSDTPAQASAAQILQAQTGGILLKAGPFDANGNRLANALTESAFALEDHYCTMMTHRRGGIIDVTIEERQSMTRFIRERRSILSELKTIIVTVSPEAESQNIAVETLTAICEAGVPPSDIRILFTEVPANSGFEDICPRVSEYARQSEISLIPDAALPASTSFAKAQHFKMPIAAVLNLAIDFETELTAARLNVSADVKMTHLAEVNLTHLGGARWRLFAADAESGASSGNQGVGKTGNGRARDSEGDGHLTQYGASLFA